MITGADGAVQTDPDETTLKDTASGETGGPAEASTLRPWWRLDFAGVLGALVMISLALTPSLLPRPWLFQGLIAGVCAALGYGIGAVSGAAIRRLTARRPAPRLRRTAWQALIVVGTLWFVVAIVAGGRWQNEVRALIGEEAAGPGNQVAGALLTIVLALLLLAFARAVRRSTRWINHRLERVAPGPVARTGGVVLVAVSLAAFAVGVGVAYKASADRTYRAINDDTPDGATPPDSSLRSGSVASAVSWESLGYHGRGFVAGGPSTAEIASFTGGPALEPIRVYAGLDSAPTAHERAELAVQELERTGAFEREVLVVAGATGRGWVDPKSTAALEYMWGGDTAIAAIQYSFLPSWLSVVVDQQRATDASRALFDEVHAKWSALPEGKRPKLIAYGLSLGSFATQSAFTDLSDITARTDGALFMGTPAFTEPWRTITNDRDRGSPAWQPVYRDGETVRFANTHGELSAPTGTWTDPRVVYLQHASDPIVAWTPRLLFKQPDWLQEDRGPDVSSATRWIPVVTFLQVTADQFFGTAVPEGHGHNYGTTIVYGWENVVPPPDWDPAQSAKLQAMIDADGDD